MPGSLTFLCGASFSIGEAFSFHCMEGKALLFFNNSLFQGCCNHALPGGVQRGLFNGPRPCFGRLLARRKRAWASVFDRLHRHSLVRFVATAVVFWRSEFVANP